MTDPTPEQEALSALSGNRPRGDLSPAAQLEYDRLKPAWEQDAARRTHEAELVAQRKREAGLARRHRVDQSGTIHWAAFASRAGGCQVTLSHGRTGQCWDNALAESFFASLKGELIDLQPWPARDMARRAIVEYIAWYNGTRLHSTLGYRSPAEFEEESKINKMG